MTFEQEQALAVFTASGEAARFIVGQKWQVTYLVLLAYAALAAAPRAICNNVANSFCAVVALGTAALASYHLSSLHQEHKDRHEEVFDAAAKELPLVLEIHEWTRAPPPGDIIWSQVAAVWIGAVLVIWINLSRR